MLNATMEGIAMEDFGGLSHENDPLFLLVYNAIRIQMDASQTKWKEWGRTSRAFMHARK